MSVKTESIPGGLTKVRPLSGCLKERPLLELEVLWGGSVGEGTSFVIGRNEIGDDGTGLEQCDVRVWVNDRCEVRIRNENL